MPYIRKRSYSPRKKVTNIRDSESYRQLKTTRNDCDKIYKELHDLKGSIKDKQ